MQTAVDKMRSWIETFPAHELISRFSLDWLDQAAWTAGLFPSGLQEISRTEDILGNVTVQNQYNFGLYYTFAKTSGEDASAGFNQSWIADFQEWVQEQSARHLAPVFGDDPGTEQITAQNGVLYDIKEEGLAQYMVQIAVKFKKFYN